jgi:D-proline reductase (dithiol) PrdB
MFVRTLCDMPEVEANHLRCIECPTYDNTPLVSGKRLNERRALPSANRGP